MNDQHAAWLHMVGLIPIPVQANSKVAAARAWQDTSYASAEEAAARFASHLGNLAVTFPSTVVCIDIDVKAGIDGHASMRDLEARVGLALPLTWAAATPSGGQHLYFDLPAGEPLQTVAGALPGVDVRAAGGYALVEPSTIDGRPYLWDRETLKVSRAVLPLAFVEALRRAPAAQVAREASSEWSGKTVAEQAETIEHLRSALTFLDPDDHDEWVAAGQALAGLGEIGQTLWGELSARSDRFPGGHGLERWDTFTGDRTGYAAIFVRAKARGWINPARGVRPALPSDASAVFGVAASPLPAGAVLERPATETVAAEFSDDTLALIFVARHSEFRWTPGVGWMSDDAVIWSRDEAMRRYDRARGICRAAAASPVVTAAERKRIASAKTVNAVLTMAQSDPRVVVLPRQWDGDLMALNTPAGVVDLRSGALRPRRADEYVTQAACVAPVAAPCPAWRKFLDEVFCGDIALIEFVQRSLGYWATGDRREQVVHFLYGRGANGKGVLMDFIKWLFGSYAHKLPASALMTSKFERHPTELAELRGKRLVVSSELDEGAFFNESLLKELTGDHTLTARFMRGDFFEFDMTHKHVIVGNFRPRLRGGDPAMARRMLLVPFNASFRGAQRDPHLIDKLKAEAPAILAWIVDGARKWNESGLAVPPAVRDASADYMEEHDDTAMWLAECCEMDTAASTRADALYGSFRNWKVARGEHAPSATAWGPRLTLVPGIEKRRSNGIHYSGVRLRFRIGSD